jgi:hypothetical protein
MHNYFIDQSWINNLTIEQLPIRMIHGLNYTNGTVAFKKRGKYVGLERKKSSEIRGY